MATTKTPSTRSRATTTTKRAPRRRATSSTTTSTQALADTAKTAVRSARTRASRAATQMPDVTTLSIAAGVIAGVVAAGVAIFMNRDQLRSVAATSGEKLRTAASTGGEKLKKAADDLSTMAHERIDQARDNITKFRVRQSDGTDGAQQTGAAEAMAITG